jgi:transcription initiation factor TFIIE subunit alpha
VQNNSLFHTFIYTKTSEKRIYHINKNFIYKLPEEVYGELRVMCCWGMKQNSKTWDSIAPRKGEETMRMTNKMAQDTITDAIGEDSLPIVDFLKNRKNISEFIISEKTEIEIHQVRNILYRMHSMNLATYKRKKDSKKGYYISYWTYFPKRLKYVASSINSTRLELLQERLAREESNKGCFFLCTNACARLDFEQSTELEFKCPECGTLLQQQDNARTIEVLKEKIKEMQGSY